jgi:hypothetical protein
MYAVQLRETQRMRVKIRVPKGRNSMHVTVKSTVCSIACFEQLCDLACTIRTVVLQHSTADNQHYSLNQQCMNLSQTWRTFVRLVRQCYSIVWYTKQQ